MTQNDDPLIDQIETLYRRRFPSFLRAAHAIVGDRERAFEAVQDGFAGAIAGRCGFRGDGPLEAWVWRVVVNAARKAARKPLAEASALREDTWEPTSEQIDIAPIVASLPERQRLVLRYYADLDYRTIAEALDIEVGTVSATLAAAHAGIRERIKEATNG